MNHDKARDNSQPALFSYILIILKGDTNEHAEI